MLLIVIHVLHLNLLKIRVVGCCLLKKDGSLVLLFFS